SPGTRSGPLQRPRDCGPRGGGRSGRRRRERRILRLAPPWGLLVCFPLHATTIADLFSAAHLACQKCRAEFSIQLARVCTQREPRYRVAPGLVGYGVMVLGGRDDHLLFPAGPLALTAGGRRGTVIDRELPKSAARAADRGIVLHVRRVRVLDPPQDRER